jgi:hypothetical protein
MEQFEAQLVFEVPTCWLSAAADTDRRLAALRKLRASATATK